MAQNSPAPAMERMQPETLDPELAHADGALGFVVVEGDAQVAGEPQVVVLAGLHPGRERVPFLLQFPPAGGVEGDARGGGLAEPVLVLCPCLRVSGGGPGLAGGPGCVFEGEQRVNGLPCPRLVQAGAGLGDRDELPEQVGVAKSVA
jgi:hypothetical protein